MTSKETRKIFDKGIKNPSWFSKEYEMLYVKPKEGDSFNITEGLLRTIKIELKQKNTMRYNRIMQRIETAQKLE